MRNEILVAPLSGKHHLSNNEPHILERGLDFGRSCSIIIFTEKRHGEG
jgi:hypothetical protein